MDLQVFPIPIPPPATLPIPLGWCTRIFHLVLDNPFYKMEPIQNSVAKMVRELEVMPSMPCGTEYELS